ncbi:short-chain dehydrogenase/reductase [Acidocella aquatica]|uniref:Short-chain dehydrogenase/reductase n=1 Tax=Acidocella aquatica TaxID=1922313 RepID=A0ABQ6A4M0_9PROT|nr:short-chain dehydrogenase/reductase [Acidocella aquatica]
MFGATHDLVLTDAAEPGLAQFAGELEAEGYTVVSARAGDLGSESLMSALMADVAGELPLTLIHTAGLSPAQAAARPIMAVNLVATVKLLNAIEPLLSPGSVAVLIASIAGHMMPPIPDAMEIMADPLADDFMDRIMALVDALSVNAPAGAPGTSYSLSKQAVIGLVERRALTWGQRGARITSISPGMILTPMGRREIAETVGAAQLIDIAAAGRAGVATDIAFAARFLASDEASFITGCDLRVDGGGTAVVRSMGG